MITKVMNRNPTKLLLIFSAMLVINCQNDKMGAYQEYDYLFPRPFSEEERQEFKRISCIAWEQVDDPTLYFVFHISIREEYTTVVFLPIQSLRSGTLRVNGEEKPMLKEAPLLGSISVYIDKAGNLLNPSTFLRGNVKGLPIPNL